MKARAAGLVLIGLLVLVASAIPLTPSEGQQAGGAARIGFLADHVTSGPTPPAWIEAFRDGLRDLGWIEGRNATIDYRAADTYEQRTGTVTELVRLKPDVIVATSPAAFLLNPTPTGTPPPRGWTPIRTVPIVFAGVSDPVGVGMVAALAKPGGNMTGLSYLGIELNTKRLQLLKDAFPQATNIGVLVPLEHSLVDRMRREIEGAAERLGVKLQLHGMKSTDPPDKLDGIFEAMARERVEAVLGLQGPLYFRERKRIAELALKQRLPGIFELAAYAEAGCLMSYAPSIADIYRRSALYVDKILKGANPADLPVEQPTKFELVINLKTAKALGLTIPPSLLLRADRVIE